MTNKCRCGITIGYFNKYCNRCKNNLSLHEKFMEGIRENELFGSQNLNNMMEVQNGTKRIN